MCCVEVVGGREAWLVLKIPHPLIRRHWQETRVCSNASAHPHHTGICSSFKRFPVNFVAHTFVPSFSVAKSKFYSRDCFPLSSPQFLSDRFGVIQSRSSAQVQLISEVLHTSLTLGVGPDSGQPQLMSRCPEAVCPRFKLESSLDLSHSSLPSLYFYFASFLLLFLCCFCCKPRVLASFPFKIRVSIYFH